MGGGCGGRSNKQKRRGEAGIEEQKKEKGHHRSARIYNELARQRRGAVGSQEMAEATGYKPGLAEEVEKEMEMES